MGLWNVYFIGKLYLYLTKHISFHLILNLLFAIALCVPLTRRWARILRQIAAVPAGIALFYYDSHLPPFARVMAQLGGISQFDPAYLLELAQRFISMDMLLGVVALLVAYWMVNHWLRVTTFTLFSVVAAPLLVTLSVCQPDLGGMVASRSLAASAPVAGQAATLTGASNPEEWFKGFLKTEATRTVAFPAAAERKGPAFDVIFLHICSLSWDDMTAAKVANEPFFGKFDVVFRRFSSAASYSGPAAIRVLRASCGQPSHQALYSAVPPNCYIMHDLQEAGFTPQVVMNHDGHFDNFAKYVQENAGGVSPTVFGGVPVQMHAFDDSPLLDDGKLLSTWYTARTASNAPAVALYYNTISMHDGNHLPNNSAPSLQTYPTRLRKLLDDVDRFTEQIAQSGHRAVVVFIPEHGAALQGDDDQVAGLREIPTYRITRVPVGVKFIGGGLKKVSGPVYVDKPTSYLALAQLLSDSTRQNPFSGAVDVAEWVAQLPTTEHVAENEGSIVMHQANADFLRTGDGVWVQEGRH